MLLQSQGGARFASDQSTQHTAIVGDDRVGFVLTDDAGRWEDDRFEQVARRTVGADGVRAVIANYSAIDVYAKKRDEAEEKVNEVIQKLFADKDIILERVLLRHIAFSSEYAQAIEDKQVAEQRIQKAEFQRQEAEKLKEKKIIEAEADAKAIELKGETLRKFPQVIQFEFVQKMAGSINWGIMPDNILPLLNLGQ